MVSTVWDHHFLPPRYTNRNLDQRRRQNSVSGTSVQDVNSPTNDLIHYITIFVPKLTFHLWQIFWNILFVCVIVYICAHIHAKYLCLFGFLICVVRMEDHGDETISQTESSSAWWRLLLSLQELQVIVDRRPGIPNQAAQGWVQTGSGSSSQWSNKTSSWDGTRHA